MVDGGDEDFGALRAQVLAAVRPALRLALERASSVDRCAARFGGLPYRERAAWPTCTTCRAPFHYLGQFDPRVPGGASIPFALGALYFCRRCSPRASARRGAGFWLDTFASPRPEAHVAVSHEEQAILDLYDVEPFHPCSVRATAIACLPHWGVVGDFIDGVDDLPRDATAAPFWRAYGALARRSSGGEDSTLFSYVGGHPYWVNGIGATTCVCGRRMDHLLQLDTEESAGFSFGKGAGLLNLFMCPAHAEHRDARDDGFADDAFRLVQQFI